MYNELCLCLHEVFIGFHTKAILTCYLASISGFTKSTTFFS